MNSPNKYLVLTNGATSDVENDKVLRLDYRLNKESTHKLNLSLPEFVSSVYHLPDRTLDLLELAGYIFGMDRCISRGKHDSVEYHAWSRNITLKQKVRDFDFWDSKIVKELLSDVLTFMLGDNDITLEFEAGHDTPPVDLFDKSDFSISEGDSPIDVTLFSGGLDSLAGALELLANSKNRIILASHQSNNTTKKTQNRIVEVLKEKYPNRISHYHYRCHLMDKRATDETQRSRSFLFTSIAFALASAHKQSSFCVFENGITSLNLRRREDLANSRASRTTHPRTIKKLEQFFSLVNGAKFTIKHPYLFKTKSDVLEIISNLEPGLLASTVSCTKTNFAKGESTHCGECFQCIDRRLASYSRNMQSLDHKGLYHFDILSESLKPDAKTIAIDYIRQAKFISETTVDGFYDEFLLDLSNVIEYLDKNCDDLEMAERLWKLFRRHSESVKSALSNIRIEFDDIFSTIPGKDTLLSLISNREYLKDDSIRIVEKLCQILDNSVSEMFATHKPKDEPDLNQKVGALLRSHYEEIRSEYPTKSFALAKVVPDHQWESSDILIETKYIRSSTTPSVATEGIAADLTKYPKNKFILFVVYDPEHKIKTDNVFKKDIELHGRNIVSIIR